MSEALPPYLALLLPEFQRGLGAAGLERAVGPSVGSYPRIKFVGRREKRNVFVDLMLGLDEHGRRFTTHDERSPFSLCAGAELFVALGERLGRFSILTPVVPEQPLETFAERLPALLQSCLEAIESFSEARLRQEGDFIELTSHHPRQPPGE